MMKETKTEKSFKKIETFNKVQIKPFSTFVKYKTNSLLNISVVIFTGLHVNSKTVQIESHDITIHT